MSTEKQIEANRLNAQKSTGPRTPQGKAASSQNAITHGLRARTVVLPDEDPREFQHLLESLRDEYSPRNASEDLLVEQAAITWWKLARLQSIEHTAWKHRCRDAAKDPDTIHLRQDLAHEHREHEFPLQADLMFHAFGISRSLERVANHLYRQERTFFRVLRDLQRLRARPNSQICTNEPNSDGRAPGDPPQPAPPPPVRPLPDPVPCAPTPPRESPAAQSCRRSHALYSRSCGYFRSCCVSSSPPSRRKRKRGAPTIP